MASSQRSSTLTKSTYTHTPWPLRSTRSPSLDSQPTTTEVSRFIAPSQPTSETMTLITPPILIMTVFLGVLVTIALAFGVYFWTLRTVRLSRVTRTDLDPETDVEFQSSELSPDQKQELQRTLDGYCSEWSPCASRDEAGKWECGCCDDLYEKECGVCLEPIVDPTFGKGGSERISEDGNGSLDDDSEQERGVGPLRTLPACNHVFHSKCIFEWISVSLAENTYKLHHQVSRVREHGNGDQVLEIGTSEREREERSVARARVGCPVCRTPIEFDIL